jgi:hypothetical protein
MHRKGTAALPSGKKFAVSACPSTTYSQIQISAPQQKLFLEFFMHLTGVYLSD